MWPFLNNVITTCPDSYCTPASSICYTGSNLSCIGVNKNDTLSVALQKINALMCVPITNTEVITALGYTPENIINKSNSYTTSSTTTYPNTKALVDGLAFVKPYKVYTALLSQSAVGNPTAVVLENTLGAITFQYITTGVYQIQLTGAFINNKTVVLSSNTKTTSSIRNTTEYFVTSNYISINCYDSTNAPADNLLRSQSIEIRVYN